MQNEGVEKIMPNLKRDYVTGWRENFLNGRFYSNYILDTERGWGENFSDTEGIEGRSHGL